MIEQVQWTDPKRHRVHVKPGFLSEKELSWILHKLDESTGSIMEIGTLTGTTAYEIAIAHPRRPLICIDVPWEETAETYKTTHGERRKHAAEGFPWVKVLLVGDKWRPTSDTSFIFIDGDHGYDAVRHDTIIALGHFMNHPGTIAWHDYGNPHCKGVTRYLDEVEKICGFPLKLIKGEMLVYCDFL